MNHKDDIVLGLVAVINGLPEKELKKELTNKICLPFAKMILEGAQSIPNSEGDEEPAKNKLSLSKVIKNLDKLSLIVKHLTPADDNAADHAMVHILRDIWTLLETFLFRFYVRLELTF